MEYLKSQLTRMRKKDDNSLKKNQKPKRQPTYMKMTVAASAQKYVATTSIGKQKETNQNNANVSSFAEQENSTEMKQNEKCEQSELTKAFDKERGSSASAS